METERLIKTDNKTLKRVLRTNGTDQGYLSYRAFYGAVISTLEDMDCDEYIDEGLFFLALNELNILHRGVMKNKVFIRTDSKDDKWYPASSNLYLRLNDHIKNVREQGLPMPDFITAEIYFWKRKSWGFNINFEYFDEQVTKPVIDLLCELNNELDEKITSKFEEAKFLLEQSGLPLNLINTKNYKQQLIAKFFKNKIKEK